MARDSSFNIKILSQECLVLKRLAHPHEEWDLLVALAGGLPAKRFLWFYWTLLPGSSYSGFENVAEDISTTEDKDMRRGTDYPLTQRHIPQERSLM
jgi:hypothetical protein